MSDDLQGLLEEAHRAVQRAQEAVYRDAAAVPFRDRLAINDAQSSLIRVLVRRAKRRAKAQDRIRRNNGWPDG